MASFVPFDENGNFKPVEGAVHHLAVRGAGTTVFASSITLGIQIAATVVLGRLLTAADFGLVAMATTFSLLLTNFGLNGFTEAVLQREKISHRLVSNLFWINLGCGALLSVGFAAAGRILARFYHEPTVAAVCVPLSLAVLLSSTSVFHVALLKRAMRFGVVSLNDIVARTVSVAVSIVCGVLGWGYWALVAGAIAQPLSQSVGAWYLCRWIPGVPRQTAGTGTMVRFAMKVFTRFGVNYIIRNSDNLLVGWRFGALPLGFYKRAYDLFALPASQILSPLTNVGVSALSRFKQDPARFQQYVIAAIAFMAFAGMGLGANLTLVGSDLIRVLLGAKWGEAGRIFTYFGPGIGIMFVYNVQGCIHLSIGRPDRWLRWSIAESLFTAMLFVLALPWGPSGIALAWTVSYWTLVVPGFWYATRPLGVEFTRFITPVWRYLVASIVAGAASDFIIRKSVVLVGLTGVGGAMLRIVVVSFLLWTLYIPLVMLLYRGSAHHFDVRSLANVMFPKISWLKRASAESSKQSWESDIASHDFAAPAETPYRSTAVHDAEL